MNEAVKLAIEKGGYRPTYTPDHPGYPTKFDKVIEYENWGIYVRWLMNKGQAEEDWRTRFSGIAHGTIALDPLFWQALGKALGWELKKCQYCKNGCEWCTVNGYVKPEWLKHAHQYFDLHLTSGDTEAFWRKLLTPQSHAA